MLIHGNSKICFRFLVILMSNFFYLSFLSGYPQSCECVENDVTKKDCSLFKCLCSCDINAGQCDYGCCCDPDCSSDQVSFFINIGLWCP